jgi:hypothetical protein
MTRVSEPWRVVEGEMFGAPVSGRWPGGAGVPRGSAADAGSTQGPAVGGNISVYRPDHFAGSQLTWSVSIDGTFAGRLKNGERLVVPVAGGSHLVSVRSALRSPTVLRVDITDARGADLTAVPRRRGGGPMWPVAPRLVRLDSPQG